MYTHYHHHTHTQTHTHTLPFPVPPPWEDEDFAEPAEVGLALPRPLVFEPLAFEPLALVEPLRRHIARSTIQIAGSIQGSPSPGFG